MSKLYDTYCILKAQDANTILLFKSGIFLIALDKDAIYLSELFHLKLTLLNAIVQKCGFPCASLDKYLELFKIYQLNVKIIEAEKNVNYHLNEYKQDQSVAELLNFISHIDTDRLSVSEAYRLIEDLKQKATDMLQLSI